MSSNSTNAQPMQNTWNPAAVSGCSSISGTFATTCVTEYTMVAKREYDALKAENEQLRARIAELALRFICPICGYEEPKEAE